MPQAIEPAHGQGSTENAPIRAKRHRRRTWKRIAAVVGGSLLLCLGALLFTTLRTPGWYDPPVVAEADHQRVRNSLVDAEQAFTEGLRSWTEPFEYHVYQADVNRWLAIRNRISPELDQFIPIGFSDPFIRFEPSRITLAGRFDTALGSVVLSIDLAITMDDGAIVLRADGLRCGSMPAPVEPSDLGLDREIDREPEETWPGSPAISGNLASGLRIGTDAWWKNGGMSYRVLDVRLEPGVLTLEIQPRGPRGGSARSRQSDSP